LCIRRSSPEAQVRIELTPEQKAVVKNATASTAEALDLSVQELEQRIAPHLFP
jgi:hypothetical protein